MVIWPPLCGIARMLLYFPVSLSLSLTLTPSSRRTDLKLSAVHVWQARFDALSDGEWDQIYDDEQKQRSDTTPDMWIDHARQFWTQPFLANEHGAAYNYVRRSEKSSDEMRDPKDRKSPDRFRVLWLEARIGEMYEEMVRVGKLLFEEFHYSWPAFLDLRPFYVKNATRETCMCVYHLRFSEYSKGLISYRKTMREQKISQCKCTWPINDRFLQRQLICPRKEGGSLDNLECIEQRCSECKDAKKSSSL